MADLKVYADLQEKEDRLLETVDDMKRRTGPPHNYDMRWLSIARTHFEEGFMALRRAANSGNRTKL